MDLYGDMQISAVDTKVCPMPGGANKHWLNALFLVLKISFLILFLCPEYFKIGLNSVPVTVTNTADTGEYINDAYSLAMFWHIPNMELHMQLTHIHSHI